jgi:hypothetical protein
LKKNSFFKNNSSFVHQTLMKNRVADTLRGSAAAVAATWKNSTKHNLKNKQTAFLRSDG